MAGVLYGPGRYGFGRSHPVNRGQVIAGQGSDQSSLRQYVMCILPSRFKYVSCWVSSLLVGLVVFQTTNVAQGVPIRRADVIIYGGTCAAVTAAVQVKKMGKTVLIVSPDKHLGGLSSGGLGFTDTGNKEVIGGLSREFYHRLYEHYQQDDAWKWQKREEYGNKGQGTPAIDGTSRTMWIFEPHAAEKVFDAFVRENGITVYRD